MTKIKSKGLGGLVYSTDPDFRPEIDAAPPVSTLKPAEQPLIIRLDTKHRAGKVVSLIEGFVGSLVDANELGKKLKAVCGTGGSVKDGEIIVQGDHRSKLLQWLQKNGYTSARQR